MILIFLSYNSRRGRARRGPAPPLAVGRGGGARSRARGVLLARAGARPWLGGQKTLSLEHQEIRGPAGQQQCPDQHRVAEQHEGQELLQHLEEVNSKGLLHGSCGPGRVSAVPSASPPAPPGLCGRRGRVSPWGECLGKGLGSVARTGAWTDLAAPLIGGREASCSEHSLMVH